jgi:hypothetical protein
VQAAGIACVGCVAQGATMDEAVSIVNEHLEYEIDTIDPGGTTAKLALQLGTEIAAHRRDAANSKSCPTLLAKEQEQESAHPHSPASGLC